MKRIIDRKRIMREYNIFAKYKISLRGATILQEDAKRKAEETGNDAFVEMNQFETIDGKVHVIK